MQTDTRSAVVEAMDRLSAEGDSDGAISESSDVAHVDSQRPEAADTAASSSDSGGDESTVGEARSAAERARDRQGRFAKEKARKAAAEAAQAKPDEAAPVDDPATPVAPAAPAAPELKPPQDWRAAAKEKWKELPRVVQEENLRTYAETRKVLDENANLRKATEPLRQTFAQHEQVLRASGAPVHQVVGSLLRTLGVLQTGTMQQRADVIAYLQRTHLGTDEQALTLLGRALDASGTGQPVQAPQALTPQQIRDLVRQEREASQTQDRQQHAVQLVNDFKAAGAEYFDQVQPEMQAIATSWRARNPSAMVTKEVLKQWYDRACELNEDTAPVIKQRKAAAEAKAKASTPAAAAAAGIKSEPAGPSGGTGKAKTTREEVARQVARLNSGRARV